MSLKDVKLDQYSENNFRVFAASVGEYLGVSGCKKFENQVDKLAADIKATSNQFKSSIPSNEGDRWKLQTSIHGDAGAYKPFVFENEPFVVSAHDMIDQFEESCINILLPLDKNTDLKDDKEIKSVIARRRSNSLALEVLPPDRTRFVKSLAKMREDTEEGFIDGVCAHGQFSSDRLTVHMPGRFAGDRTDWDIGRFTCNSVEYVLPTGDVGRRFSGNETNKNIVVDTRHQRYFVRDNRGILCEFDRNGRLRKEIRQGSLGDGIGDIKRTYRTLLKV